MTRLQPRLVLICLALLVAGVRAASAQPATPRLPRWARGTTLDLHFDYRGGVRASLRLPFPPPSPEMWRQALAAALKRPLQQVREERAGASWTLHAQADAVLDRSGGTMEGDLDLSALRDWMMIFGIGRLVVSIEHPAADFSECRLEEAVTPHGFLFPSYSVVVSARRLSPPLHLRFGFRPENAWRFLPLLLVLLAPIALVLWRRRSRPGEEDRFVAWFRYWRFHKRLILAVWIGWLIAAAALGAIGPAGFLLCGVLARGEMVWMVVFLVLPPALVSVICKVLSAPAFARVPELEWTRGRLLRQGLWMQFGLAGMAICAGRGVDSLTEDFSLPTMLLYEVAAIGLFIFCLTWANLARSGVVRILPPGPVRERLFELADQARVRVRQAFHLPPAAWRLLNAVSSQDGVHICSEVLPHLSRREVDALLALELAYLWRRSQHSLRHILGFLGLMVAAGVGIGTMIFLNKGGSIWPLMPFIIVSGLLWELRQPGHHFMARLDRAVLKITGDPESLLTALAKLRRLDLLPLVAGEERSAREGSLTDWQRLQDLADRAGIPPERLDEILAGPGSGSDRYPPLEAAPEPAPGTDTRVFSREFKRRAYAQQTRAGLVVEIALPVLIAYLVQEQHWHGLVLALVYLAGLPLTIWFRRFVVARLAAAASRRLRRGLRDKLARDGLQPEAWGGLWVSLSPHGEPRLYESFFMWDPGFLVLSGERLCYLGDQTRFALERRHIRDVYLGPGPPGWRRSRRVYVSWWDEERGLGGVFNLVTSEKRIARRAAARSAALAKRLRDWLKQPAAEVETPPSLHALPAPNFGAVPSESFGKFATGNILLALLFLRAPFAIGACLLLGLSFEPHAPAAGWYVLGSMVLIQTWTILAFLPYRLRERDALDRDAPASGAIDPAARSR